ncbi:Ribosomal RNA small subunit methyltransferase F [compost metagenome]
MDRGQSKNVRKKSNLNNGKSNYNSGKKGLDDQEMINSWSAFADEQLLIHFQEQPLLFGGNVYLSPVTKEKLDGLKTVRPGWYVGTSKNGRFQPGHPLATALKLDEAARVLDLSSRETEAVRYLKGETLEIPESRINRSASISPRGYVLVTVDGYSLGWGKWLDGMLKNDYPAGWRWT